MPRGSNVKREREYKELKKEFEKTGRYEGREEEVAARIVNKQRAELGETREAKAKTRKGKSPDRNLPISGYDHLTVPDVVEGLESLSGQEVKKIKTYEQKHKNRKTLLERIDRKLKEHTAAKR